MRLLHRLANRGLDVERPEGTTHANLEPQGRVLTGWLTPATALALVEPLVLEIDDKLSLSVASPDVDAPSRLEPGQLTITRLAGATETERIYQFRLVRDRVASVARLVIEGDGVPRSFKISSTTRPVVRTWKRRN
jgi:hypothetical protein